MENSSKALIIAGSVLVSILIAAVGVQVYNTSGKGAGEQAKQATEKMWEDLDMSVGITKKSYVIGDEVTVKGESFYIIEDSDEKQDKVVLLAKQCINTNKLEQTATPNGVSFSKTQYWESGTTDIIEEGEIDETHYAIKAAYDYGLKIGGKGRLMLHKEAIDLSEYNEEMKNIIFGINGYGYWLGTVQGAGFIKFAYCKGDWSFQPDSYYGSLFVRPVVEISKSLVQNVE